DQPLTRLTPPASKSGDEAPELNTIQDGHQCKSSNTVGGHAGASPEISRTARRFGVFLSNPIRSIIPASQTQTPAPAYPV
ncbi:hypothetical protein, partial [Ferrimicrobium acidiphilum]|uniref:hypothetical protein n=1 Tax=Ferrimicrobium acidiphilum TaxID=121039 RepID=UPI0023F1586D